MEPGVAEVVVDGVPEPGAHRLGAVVLGGLSDASSPGYSSSGSPSLIVDTARQSWAAEHGTLTEPSTVEPAAQTSHSSSACTSSPSTSAGRSTSCLVWSPPPTTSQRYHRAPWSHASFDGRNHAQVRIVRIAVLSSAPTYFRKRAEHFSKANAPSSFGVVLGVLRGSPAATRRSTSGPCASRCSPRSVSRCSAARGPSAVSRRQAPRSGASTASTWSGSAFGGSSSWQPVSTSAVTRAARAAATERTGRVTGRDPTDGGSGSRLGNEGGQVPPSSYAASSCASVGSPSTSSTGAACRQGARRRSTRPSARPRSCRTARARTAPTAAYRPRARWRPSRRRRAPRPPRGRSCRRSA